MRKISVKGWQKKLEHQQRNYLIQLRGPMCEICQELPAVVADHCFSRKVRQLFFELANMTVVCSPCHFKKTHRIKQMDLEFYVHVENREGKNKFYEMRQIAHEHKPFPDFSKRSYLETVQNKLNELTGGNS